MGLALIASALEKEFGFKGRDGLDIAESVDSLLGMAAGNQYEGWPDYWQDQGRFEEKMLDLLREWINYGREHAIKS